MFYIKEKYRFVVRYTVEKLSLYVRRSKMHSRFMPFEQIGKYTKSLQKREGSFVSKTLNEIPFSHVWLLEFSSYDLYRPV